MKHDSAQAAVAADPSASIREGTWLVKTTSGVQAWTLDELDLAFQRGAIDAATPVFTAGMTAWQTLGLIAGLDAPAAEAAPSIVPTTAQPPQPSSPPSDAAPPRRPLPPPRRVTPPPKLASTRRRLAPPPIADGKSFPPTTATVFGSGAAWASVAPIDGELQTGVRRKAARLPFALRLRFAGIADFAANLMAHLHDLRPRWALLGPWLFGASLSGILIVALYQLANAPTRPGAYTRSGAAVSYAAASVTPIARQPAPAASARAPSDSSANLAGADVAPHALVSPSADREPLATTHVAGLSIPNGDVSESADDGVLRTRDLKLAPTRSERRASRRAQAKAKAASKQAASKRSTARAARSARRSQRAPAFAQ